MPYDYLNYPKQKPSSDYGAGFDSYTPRSSIASAFGGSQAPPEAPGFLDMASMAGKAAGPILPWATAAFDIYGGIQKANTEADLQKRAEAEYMLQRDKEAEDQRKLEELQRVKALFEAGTYAGQERQGLHTNYDQYYQNIGL
jgi:hypothetical protein